MNVTPIDILIATVVAVCAGIAFTIWKFRGAPPHDRATTRLLKTFFEGKQCAICKRSIAPMHRMGLNPGLMNPKTGEIHSWDEIPDADLPKALETHLPVCSECEVAESLRQRFPDRVVDQGQPLRDARTH